MFKKIMNYLKNTKNEIKTIDDKIESKSEGFFSMSDDHLFRRHLNSDLFKSIPVDEIINHYKKISIQRDVSKDVVYANGTMDSNYALKPQFVTGLYNGNNILYSWYAAQGFIGWQMSAILSQHWLINRCCRIPSRRLY